MNTDLELTTLATAGDASQRISLPPAFVGGYRLGRVLGRGAMGMVVEGWVRATGGPVAIKFLTRLDDDDIRERFLREGRILMKIRHPHVLRVDEIGALEAHPYLVTELVPGGCLRDRMRRKPDLTPREAARIAIQCLEGVAACHGAGVIHRDLKPENVLITTDGDAKVADLGIAKAYDELSRTRTGALIGTPLYMSPEQARGEPVGIASDLYSMGAILYELLAGAPPFTARRLTEILECHISMAPPPLAERAPATPPGVIHVVHAALAKKIADRPGSANEMAELLRRALAPAHPVRVRPATRALEVAGVRAPRPARVALVSAAVFTLLAVLLSSTPLAESGRGPGATPISARSFRRTGAALSLQRVREWEIAAGSTRVRVGWATVLPCYSRVEFWSLRSPEHHITRDCATSPSILHSLTLSGLAPQCTYMIRPLHSEDPRSSFAVVDETYEITTHEALRISQQGVALEPGRATIRWVTNLPSLGWLERADGSGAVLARDAQGLSREHAVEVVETPGTRCELLIASSEDPKLEPPERSAPIVFRVR